MEIRINTHEVNAVELRICYHYLSVFAEVILADLVCIHEERRENSNQLVASSKLDINLCGHSAHGSS